MKKIVKNKIIVIIILICIAIFASTAGIKIVNYIYGQSHPPIPLRDIYTWLFCSDGSINYDRVEIIEYWDASEEVRYRGYITDKEVINNIYILSGNMKIKQTIIDDALISYEKSKKLMRNSYLRIAFDDGTSEEHYFLIVNKQYIDDVELWDYNPNKLEIVGGSDELFDYLNTIGDYVEQ